MATQKAIRISKERKELLAKYADAAVNLYGMLSVDEFVKVFNHYDVDAQTTHDEALLALMRYEKANRDIVEYSLKNELLSGPEFQPAFDEYEDDVEYYRSAQKGKPRYLPSKEEFLRYVDYGYREPEKPYADLKSHIVKNKMTKKEANALDGVDGDLMDFHEFIQIGIISGGQEIEFFTDRGYTFRDIDAANAFLQVMMNAHNNTRMFENNGHTPYEIFEKFERPKLRPFPKEQFDFEKMSAPTKMPSKNGPCPCESGKKYKRCCGKE